MKGGRYQRSKSGGTKRVAHTAPRARRHPRKQYEPPGAPAAKAPAPTADKPKDKKGGEG